MMVNDEKKTCPPVCLSVCLCVCPTNFEQDQTCPDFKISTFHFISSTFQKAVAAKLSDSEVVWKTENFGES